MKHILFCFLVISFFGVMVSSAAAEKFGLGIIQGDPTGLSGKFWLSNQQAIAGGVAWSFRKGGTLHLHGDYIFHHDLSGEVKGDLQKGLKTAHPYLYYGVGGRLKDEIQDRISVRFPIGLTTQFNNAPIDAFIEIVPLLDLAPATEFDLNAAIGARFYF